MKNFHTTNMKILKKGGKSSIILRVITAEMEADLVRKRCKLKEVSNSIVDQFSNEEFKHYKLLQPHFLKAVEERKKAFFKRAIICVNGTPFLAHEATPNVLDE